MIWPYFRAGKSGLVKESPDMFWHDDHISTQPPVCFKILFILVKTEWTFEAVITPFLQIYHYLLLLRSLVSNSVFDIFSFDMLTNKFAKKIININWFTNPIVNAGKIFRNFISLPLNKSCNKIWPWRCWKQYTFRTNILQTPSAKSFSVSIFISPFSLRCLYFLFGVDTNDRFFSLAEKSLRDQSSCL